MRDKLNFEGFINSPKENKEIKSKVTNDSFNFKWAYYFMVFFAVSIIAILIAGIYLINEDKFKTDINQPISTSFNSTTENTFNNDIKLNPTIVIHLNQTNIIERVVVNSVNSS